MVFAFYLEKYFCLER